MALSAGSVSLGVKADTNGFGKKLSDGIMGESSSFGGVGKKIGGLIVGGLAAAGVGIAIGSILKTGFDEAKDASAGVAQLTAGIISTGNAANVSVDGMESLASSIQNMSGQTDDSIVGAQKLLLTFTNIKNSGPNKIFDDATLAAANMAAKMGGDASSQAILLGKALNDPVKGVSALTRVGVSFTEGQKKSIEAMVDSGNTMGAQKLILGELNKEFGGAAKAAGQSLPGQLERAKRGFEDISQSVMEGILPIVTPAIVGISSALQKAAPYVAEFSAAMAVKLTAAAAVFPRIGAALVGLYKLVAQGDFTGGLRQSLGLTEDSSIVSTILTIRDGVIGAFFSVKKIVDPIGATIRDTFNDLAPSIKSLIAPAIGLAVSLSPLHLIFTSIGPVLPPLVAALGRLAVSLGTEVAGAVVTLAPTLIAIAHTISVVLAGSVQVALPIIVGLFDFISNNTWLIWGVVGAFVAWKTIAGTIALVNGAIALTQGLMLGVSAASYGAAGATYAVGAAQKSAFAIATIFNGILWKQVAALIASKAETVALVAMYTGGFIASVARNIAGVTASTAAWIANTAAQIGAKAVILGGVIAIGAATAAQWLWNAAMDANPIGLIVMAIAGLVAGIIWVATQTTFFQDVWSAMCKFVQDAIAVVVGWVSQNWGLLLSLMIGPLGLVIQWVVEHWSGIVDFFGTALSAIGGFFSSVFGGIGGIIRGAFNGVVDFVRGIFNNIIGVVNGIIDGINTATGLAGAIGIHIGKIPHLPKLADSGTVLPRPGGTLVVAGEGGKAESVVDTGKLNKLMDAASSSGGRGGDTFNIYEVVSARATAMQVSRRQNSLAAV